MNSQPVSQDRGRLLVFTASVNNSAASKNLRVPEISLDEDLERIV